MMNNLVVSIIICTKNRADSLKDTIISIGKCNIPSDISAELVIVDNGSTDHTQYVIESTYLANMTVRCFFEPMVGLSHARNRGMAEALGGIFLWTDDDVRVPVNWIEGMCRPIEQGQADATAGEILIAPHLLRSWMTKNHRMVLTEIVNLQDQHKKLPFMIGANMAFGRWVLSRVKGFDVALGAGALGYMDDTLFYLQLLNAGFSIKYVAGFAVEHHFDEDRLLRSVQNSCAKKHGRSAAWVMHHWSHEDVHFRQIKLLTNLVRMSFSSLMSRVLAKRHFDPLEIEWRIRFWKYFYLGRMKNTPRKYDKFGCERL